MSVHVFVYASTECVLCACGVFSEKEEGSAHPFAVLPGVSQHLLQGPHRQGLLQHKAANTQVWRNILQGGRRERQGRKKGERAVKSGGRRNRGKETVDD